MNSFSICLDIEINIEGCVCVSVMHEREALGRRNEKTEGHLGRTESGMSWEYVCGKIPHEGFNFWSAFLLAFGKNHI